MTANLDIVNLIERNSFGRFSKNQKNKLIANIEAFFTEEEQKIFAASFSNYLDYNSTTDYIVDLDKIWKWVGFSRKDHAKVLLRKHFIENIDYKIVFPQLQENLNSGRPSEQILLNIKTFKKFCLKAGTKKADEIHDYYIKLEELFQQTLQETLQEETNQLKLQLQNKEEENQKLKTALNKRNIAKKITNEKFVIYLLIAYINGRVIYIIGKSADVNKRYRTYKLKGILIPEKDIKLVYFKSCRNSKILTIVEKCVLLDFSKNLILGTLEIFEFLDSIEDQVVKNFKESIDFFVNRFSHIASHITIENKNILPIKVETVVETEYIVEEEIESFEQEIEDFEFEYSEDEKTEEIDEETDEENENIDEYRKENNRIRTELYVEENRDEVNENVREDRKQNPEKYRIREKEYTKKNPEKKKAKNKKYRDSHKEEIAKKEKEYYEKNKEKVAERQKIYQEKNKDKKSTYLKSYREEKKDVIKAQRTERVECCVCKINLSKQCWRRHTRSENHKNNLILFPTRKDEYEKIENSEVKL